MGLHTKNETIVSIHILFSHVVPDRSIGFLVGQAKCLITKNVQTCRCDNFPIFNAYSPSFIQEMNTSTFFDILELHKKNSAHLIPDQFAFLEQNHESCRIIQYYTC